MRRFKTAFVALGLVSAAFADPLDLSTVSWLKSRTGDVVTIDSNAKTVTFLENQASASLFVANVPAINVNVGESLVVTWVFNVAGANANANVLRFGFFDSNGTVPSILGGDTNTAFDDDLGYMTSITVAGANPGLYGRNPGTSPSNLLGSATATYWSPATGVTASGTAGAFAAGNTYTLTQKITRNAGSTDLVTTLNGGAFSSYTLSGTDTSSASIGTDGADVFNQLGIRIGGGMGAWSSMTLTSLDMTLQGSAIPEPSTYAALAGAAVFGVVIYRRRKK